MAVWNYEACHARTLSYEGGFADHPADPGGVTLEGVTQAVYDSYRNSKGLPRKALSASMRTTQEWIAERCDIYRTLYWDKVRGDDLPAGVDLAVYDYGVNSGVVRAAKVLQRLVGVSADGVIGPVTLAAVVRRDPVALIAALCDERLAFLKSLKTWPVFGKGWSHRVADVKREALAMAAARPVAGAALSGAAGAVIIGGTLAAAQVHTAEAARVFVILIAVATLLAAGWLLWRRHKDTKEA